MGNPYAPPGGQPRPPREEAPPAPPAPTPPPTPPARSLPSPPSAPGRGPQAPAPDPQEARRATRKVLHFGLLLLGVIVLMSLPFPWRLVTLVIVLGAMVAGVRALLAVWRARVRGALAPALVLGVGLSGVLLLQILAMAATWEIEAAYQSCLDGAITVSAEDRCTAEYQRSREDWLTSRMPQQAG